VKKRIVVTGMGVVSCFGTQVDNFYRQLLAGVSGVKTITSFPTEELATKFAATVTDFDPELFLEKKQAPRVDKFIAFGVAAGKLALEMARLNPEHLAAVQKQRCGIVLGSGMGGMGVFVDGALTLAEKGPRRISPFFIPYMLSNMAGGLLGMELGFMGPNYSISTACATGNYSIIAAANHIRRGDADLMICGGSEAAVIPLGLAGFSACKALSKRNEAPERASRPWDKGRDGFVMGEGAAALVLESLDHALARGAPIYGEYLGGGLSCDAHHITEPRPDGSGVVQSIMNALQDAEIPIERVNYVNAHATSTPVGDMAEISAMKQVFKGDRSKVAVNATKSMIGHSLGAAAAFEAVVALQAIQTGKLHPTINLEDPEPNLEFFIPTEAVDWKVDVALSNSFGFGGHNASILFSKYN